MKWYVYFTDWQGVKRCHCFEDNEQEAKFFAELVNGGGEILLLISHPLPVPRLAAGSRSAEGLPQKRNHQRKGGDIMSKQPTIIKVRRGINGFKYSACDEHGYFIGNFKKLSDVRRHWLHEIKWGQVVLVRELDQMPDMSKIEETSKTVEKLLEALTKK